MDITAIVLALPSMVLGGILTVLAGTGKLALQKFLSEQFGKTDKYATTLVKDPKVVQTIMFAFIAAQKELGSEKGKEKFKLAKEIVLKASPDLWDGAVDVLIQTVYDEFVATKVDSKFKNMPIIN
jgi:hypothetical protein